MIKDCKLDISIIEEQEEIQERFIKVEEWDGNLKSKKNNSIRNAMKINLLNQN